MKALSYLLLALPAFAQPYSVHWEELTAAEFTKALAQAQATCTLPFGIIEKHGPSGPLGTDLLNVRYIGELAARQEYTILFPPYYFGQIFEARHQPGTIAYSTRLELELLQETASEMARNGCKKVIILNGHGGNTAMLQYFAQVQLDTPKDYLVYVLSGLSGTDPAARPSKPGVDGHAGEGEISNMMAHRPDLAHPERAGEQSGKDLRRLDLPAGVFTGISWYSRFPNHYQGDSTAANEARGKASTASIAMQVAAAIRAIKSDSNGPRLQKEFFDAAQRPNETKQHD